ncbi:MAG: hypothetical protein ACU0DW_15400 [Shimia sp.]
MRALFLIPALAACGMTGASAPPAAQGPAIGSSQAEAAQALGIEGDSAQLPGGAVCVTYPGQGDESGFVHAIFVNGQLSRISRDNFVTCTGDFA